MRNRFRPWRRDTGPSERVSETPRVTCEECQRQVSPWSATQTKDETWHCDRVDRCDEAVRQNELLDELGY